MAKSVLRPGARRDGQCGHLPPAECLLMMLWTAPARGRKCPGSGRRWGDHDWEEAGMQAVTTIGLDIAKSVFQVHGVDATGKVIIRRQLKRPYVLAFFQKLSPCLVGI